MSDPSYPAYPILAFSASFLVLIPLSWHWQTWNAGTCLYMIWTSLACFNLAVNSIMWRDNSVDLAPVWCDISSRIIVATAVAIPASSLCIVRRLYKIASMHSASLTVDEKRKAAYTDVAIGVGLPVLQLVTQYIVSGHRYDIYGDIGCYPFTYNTPVAYPLSITWPVVIGVISLVYSVLTLWAFIQRRASLTALFSSNQSFTAHRYLRLMGLATFEGLCTIPISSYGMYLNIRSGLQPWISWSDTHFGYSQIHQIPSLLWRFNRNGAIALELSRWLPVFCALVFFCFFGFAEEARRNYSRAFQVLAERYRFRLPFHPFSVLQSRQTPATSQLALSLPPYTNSYQASPSPTLSPSKRFANFLRPDQSIEQPMHSAPDVTNSRAAYVIRVLDYKASSSIV